MSRQALEIELARLTERYEEQPAGRVFAPLADCHRKLGQLDSALQICLTGLARHPEYSSAQLILGKIFLDRGEDDRARESLERVLELDPQNLLAMRLLAELAERLGELHEAQVRWRQLDALDYDPALTSERLAELAGRIEGGGPDAPAGDAPDDVEAVAGEDAEAARETGLQPVVAEEPSAVEPDDDEAPEEEPVVQDEAPEEEPEEEPARPVSSIAAPTSEIATLTLAGIYAEQGFKAKALEIYRAIAARNPDLPGLSERIEAIESAMARVERDAVEEIAPADDDELGLEVVSIRPTYPAPDDSSRPVPSQPLFSDVPAPNDPVGDDASRYRRFGTWLERVRSDDED